MHLRSGSASTAQVISGPPMPRLGFEPQRLRVFFGFSSFVKRLLTRE